MFGWLPGASEQDIIDRELKNGDLNARGNDFADRSGSWNWQDDFGAWLAGTNKDKVLAGAKTKRDKQLTDAYGGRAATAKANLGPLTAQYQGVSGKTKQEIEAALAGDEARALALSDVQGLGLDVSSLAPTASVGAIRGAGAKATKQAGITTRDEARSYAQLLLTQSQQREDALTERMNTREDRKDARAELTRAQERKDALELRRDNMNLEYARLAQAERQKAADRKDKAIMMLIQGLGNLGTAFTI